MSELSELRQLLSAYFNESELKTLTFDLGLDYEMLPGPAKGDKARELVMLLWRSGRLAELVALGGQMRPNVSWPALPAPAAPPVAATQAPVVTTTSGGQSAASPFTYGNPISDPARFFGRSREVEQVFNRLRNAEGESSSIVGGRRIGKSSLLNYLAHPDVRRRYGMDPQQALFVYVDLQMVDGQTTPARLWQRLLAQLARQGQDEALAVTLNEIIAAGSFDNFALADLFDNVDRLGRHIVFLLDEFENVTTNPNFDPSFFYGLRSLAIQHNLSLVTSSRHELIELTHSQAVRSSPFFNIFATIHVPLFSQVETERLIHGLLAGTGVEFTEEEMATLAEIADGHPFFVQAAGHFLFEAHGDYADAIRRRAAWLKAFHVEVGPHLAHFWRTTDLPGQITLLLLALLMRRAGGRPYFDPGLLEGHYARAGQNLARLARLGYVAEESGRFTLFSSAFAEWIVSEVRSGSPAPRGEAHSTVEAVLNQAQEVYRPMLAGLVEQAADADQTMQLLREGLV
ncbi:MAG: AAA-like domain-containing protein [Candidatus Promineofilum sp.]|nr:AAA-like domain-containing protein [Promineifilum sp.]